MQIDRVPGKGWLVLVGGGEFSFGETLAADRAWLAKVGPGSIGFVPAASGSIDYGRHFSRYLEETFERRVEVVPLYRPRDARRRKNCGRITAAAAVYLGGGVPEHLLDTLQGTPAEETLRHELEGGGVLVGIAAAAQALGCRARSLVGSAFVPGLGWLGGGAVEPNFDPAHDRRLRQLVGAPEVEWGLGVPAGSAVLLGPDKRVEFVGPVIGLEDPDGDLIVLNAAE